MVKQIRKVAVIGSGVMGSGIAAHLVNCGIPTLMLDIVPKDLTEAEKAKGLTLEDRAVRNRIVEEAKKRLLKQKPAPLTHKDNLALLETGNLEDDIERIAEADWIIEVVVEKLEVKQQVFAQIDQYRKPGSIVSSNTSGISVHKMAEGRSEDFKKHFLGTHFFNPPRYLKLLEIIPTKDTDPEVAQFMKKFGENVLGKGVVFTKDTPNFIANRIGTFGLLVTLKEVLDNKYSIGEVDSITGPLIGRPKSATFRTLDVVGLDTFIHVANNVYEQTEGKEKEAFKVPELLHTMLEKGWLGSKSGQGFYLKKGKDILELNVETLEYEPRKKLKTASTEMAKQSRNVRKNLQKLVFADDRAGQLLWRVFAETLLYTAEIADDIADDIVAIDNAMKWGFGWELGPFESWDAIGLEKSVAKMKEEGYTIPGWIEDMLASGFTSFYKEEKDNRYYYHAGEYRPLAKNPKEIDLPLLKKQGKVIRKNTGASLIDIGDDVLLLEFHSQNNAIGLDILQMINEAVDEVEKNWKGLVIGNKGKNFCVGAHLGLMLMEAQEGNFDELDFVVRKFQQTMLKIKYSTKPVVAAPHQMTLGGGAEVCLPAARIQASPETYIGLVETGVGLIPGGGGTKELYIKHLENMPKGVKYDLQEIANKVFETVAMAKVSTSAEEAREYGFLGALDGISRNPDHLHYDAKQVVLDLYEKGYQGRPRKKIPVVGETGYAVLLLGAQNLYYSGYISEHDLKIAKKLAYVLAGGKLPFGTEVEEQYLLDLEREAFLSLIGEPKTQMRMQHMLLKGKPLRN